MEVDQTILTEEEIQYWCEEYPDLDREEVIEILDIINMDKVKDEFWQENPTLEESDVKRTVAKCAAASYEHHLYHDLDNEAQ